jgi:ParB family chromosome partitioning protein
MTDNAQLINQSSGIVEYYSPPDIIEVARLTMGRIDLDPASSPSANRIVRASNFFTAEMDGLSRDWFGNVWMNHPFGKAERACKPGCAKAICRKRGFHLQSNQPGNADWINHLLAEYKSGNIEQACCITFAATSEKWFRPLMQYPQCFLSPRTNYLLPDGTNLKGVTKGSVVTYLGPGIERFAYEFDWLGAVMVRYGR